MADAKPGDAQLRQHDHGCRALPFQIRSVRASISVCSVFVASAGVACVLCATAVCPLRHPPICPASPFSPNAPVLRLPSCLRVWAMKRRATLIVAASSVWWLAFFLSHRADQDAGRRDWRDGCADHCAHDPGYDPLCELCVILLRLCCCFPPEPACSPAVPLLIAVPLRFAWGSLHHCYSVPAFSLSPSFILVFSVACRCFAAAWLVSKLRKRDAAAQYGNLQGMA